MVPLFYVKPLTLQNLSKYFLKSKMFARFPVIGCADFVYHMDVFVSSMKRAIAFRSEVCGISGQIKLNPAVFWVLLFILQKSV